MNWNGIAGGITTGLNTYQTMAQLFAQKQKADQEAAVAKAYGQAMQSMANPAAIDLGPLGGKVQPQAPDMTMQNFARAMPQGLPPEVFGAAANQFLPVTKTDSLADYRTLQGQLGQQRLQQGDRRLDQGDTRLDQQGRNIDSQIDTRAGQLDQGQQKIEIQNKRAALAERQAIITNGFREKEIQLSQQKGVNPVQKANFDRLKYTLGLASKAVANIQFSGMGDIDAALAAQEALKQQLDSFDTTGVGLPPAMPANNGLPAPAPAPVPAPIDPGAIRILQSNPTPATRKYFEDTFKQPADKYLQPVPKPQSSLGAPPGPQGGPFVAMKSPTPSMTERNMLTSENIDPAVAQRLANRTASAGDIQSANQGISGQRPQGSMAGAGQTPALPGEAAPIDAGSWGQDDAVEAQKIQQELQKAGVVSEGMDLPELRIRRAMLNYRDNVGGAVKEAKAIAPRVSALANRNRPTEPTARPVTLRNPYMTMTETQKSAEMRRLSIQMYAAKTARERAEVDKKLDQLLKASSPRAASAPGA